MSLNEPLVVWAADIGSISGGKFGWCRATRTGTIHRGTCIKEFATGIADDLSAGNLVAVGFECPTFIPIADDPQRLTKARCGEKKAWCVNGGAGSLAIGLAESVWAFERIRDSAKVPIRATLDWDEFVHGGRNLFIWEAYVTGASKGKGQSHEGDAQMAAEAFLSKLPYIPEANTIRAENPLSLVGVALLRSRLTTDLDMLLKSCVVIEA